MRAVGGGQRLYRARFQTFPEFALRGVEVAAVDRVFARVFIGQLAIRAGGNMSP